MTVAFVAGATGYTGREVVRELRALGVRTVAHVRPDSQRAADFGARFLALGAEPDSTPWRPEKMKATLTRLRPDLVFALLGTTRRRIRRASAMGTKESYESVDYGLSRMLLDAAAASGSNPRFIYLSAVGVSPGARAAYLKVRARLEDELTRSGLPFTIARPSFITGSDRDEDRPLERLLAGATESLSRFAARLGYRGTERLRPMSGATLANALVRLALDPAAKGSVVEAEDLRRGDPGSSSR